MTAYCGCGGPLDPDTIHVQHRHALYGCDKNYGCDCPEVCADCCTHPDCALREPQETKDG